MGYRRGKAAASGRGRGALPRFAARPACAKLEAILTTTLVRRSLPRRGGGNLLASNGPTMPDKVVAFPPTEVGSDITLVLGRVCSACRGRVPGLWRCGG